MESGGVLNVPKMSRRLSFFRMPNWVQWYGLEAEDRVRHCEASHVFEGRLLASQIWVHGFSSIEIACGLK